MNLSVLGFLAATAAYAASAVSAAPVLRFEIGPERIVCGVTAPAGAAKAPGAAAPGNSAPGAGPHSPGKRGLLLWFHGGMRSQNREKGLEAHRQLLAFADTSRFVMASASAFAGRDWLDPAAIRTVDALIDTLHALYSLGGDLRLVGVSDGCLGVIRYASAGRWRAGRMLLVSSLPQLAVPETQLRSEQRLLEGRWDFLQGGRDRLFPAQVVMPFLKTWEGLNPEARLHFFPDGEHDFSYYSTHAAPLLRELLGPAVTGAPGADGKPDRHAPRPEKPKKS